MILPDRKTVNIGVLASGRGSNLEALLRAEHAGQFSRATVTAVASNIESARALTIARDAGVHAEPILPENYPDRATYERAVLAYLQSHRVDLLVLAGYMKIVGETLLEAFPLAAINIHPSLLPSFRGLHAQRQAMQHGVRFSGCTVHFVSARVDEGPIIAQRVVPVLPADDENTLAARILAQEHELLPAAIRLLTERTWQITGRRFELLDEDPRS